MKSESRLLRKEEGISPSGRVVDPSEAVTGLGFIFGLIGVVAGIVAVFVASPDPVGAITVLYCVQAAFAGGSAGIVTGGMIGALFAVARGVVPGRRNHPVR